MKLKKLLEGFAWERESGKPLPTLKDVAKKHNLNERPISRSKVDYSTMNLKSNINIKWTSTEDMEYDLRQWVGGVISASGPQLAREIGLALKEMGTRIITNQDDFSQYGEEE